VKVFVTEIISLPNGKVMLPRALTSYCELLAGYAELVIVRIPFGLENHD
jgi:hypothetical protein